MEILQAIIYGIIQGLTEFLPVSSSGHLEIAKAIFGDEKVPEESMMMTVVLHAATALSTIFIFRKDIADILKGLFKTNGNGLISKENEDQMFSLKIILSMIPAAAVGVLFEDEIDTFFTGNVLLVGGMLLVTGVLLLLADKAKNTDKPVGIVDSIIVGIAQAIAIMPGISRSGATISTSVLLGIDRSAAARFSFLMVVPLILGKMAKDILSGDLAGSTINFVELGVGFVAAFVSGLIACKWMIALVKRSKLTYFSIYCFIVGIIAIGYSIL